MSELAVRSKVEQTPVGLRLPEHMPFDEWAALGVELSRAHSTVSWAMADWLFYGEWEYGRMYEQALDATGLSYSTLADLKYVAGRFDHSRRVKELSMGHHREVAPLPLGEADGWLEQAKGAGWSTKQLRDAVARGRSRLGGGGARVDQDEVVMLTLDFERIARWRAAALHVRLELEDWIVAKCDEAAA